MADAFFHKGLTIECDDRLSVLRVDGNRIEVEKRVVEYHLVGNSNVHAPSLLELGKLFIDRSPEYACREQLRRRHLEILNQGRRVWNNWRTRQSHVRPVLYGERLGRDIRSRDLREFDFSWAGLSCAQLQEADLTGANFFQSHLAQTDLTHATLDGAHFCRADLYETNLTDASLIGANLQGAQLAKTILSRATLSRCPVYGMSAWDVRLDGAVQKDFIVRYRCGSDELRSGAGFEAEISVDDLQIAQFIYLMLDNPRLRVFLEGTTHRGVLILGRFTDERKAVLDRLRTELRALQYASIVFDFDVPETDLIQTVKRLAGLSRFVIGDITDPRSIPLELLAILSTYRIPVVPIIQAPEEPFSMMAGLQDIYAPCVLEVHRYQSDTTLIGRLDKIVEAAIDVEARLASARTEPRKIVELTTDPI